MVYGPRYHGLHLNQSKHKNCNTPWLVFYNIIHVHVKNRSLDSYYVRHHGSGWPPFKGQRHHYSSLSYRKPYKSVRFTMKMIHLHDIFVETPVRRTSVCRACWVPKSGRHAKAFSLPRQLSNWNSVRGRERNVSCSHTDLQAMIIKWRRPRQVAITAEKSVHRIWLSII